MRGSCSLQSIEDLRRDSCYISVVALTDPAMIADLNALPIDERRPTSRSTATSGCPWPGPSTATRPSTSGLRLLIEPVPAIVWTTDRELRFTSGLGGGLASFGLRAAPGTSLFDHYGTRDPDALPSAPTSSPSAASR